MMQRTQIPYRLGWSALFNRCCARNPVARYTIRVLKNAHISVPQIQFVIAFFLKSKADIAPPTVLAKGVRWIALLPAVCVFEKETRSSQRLQRTTRQYRTRLLWIWMESYVLCSLRFVPNLLPGAIVGETLDEASVQLMMKPVDEGVRDLNTHT